MNKVILAITTLLLISLNACTSEVICTMDFRAVMVEIPNLELDETITIDQVRGETAVVSSAPYPSKIYTVLSDNYLDELKNKEHNFRFLGLMNGDTLVDEVYAIGADDCHIYKVSGPATIEK
ncbi:MAG: hypothetical protein AAF399_00700 [Bacteroidota bacterium]